MMRASRDWSAAMASLDVIKSAGYHGIRTWDRLRWGPLDANKPISGDWGHEIVGMPTWMAQCRGFYRACQERGLRLHVAAGDLAKFQGGQRADYFAARKALAEEFGDFVVFNEWANESRDTSGGLTSAVAERDMAGLRALPNLVTLSAYTGHEDIVLFREWTKSWQAFVQVHGSRAGHWWDKTRHIFSLPYEVWNRRPWLQSEPFGPGALVSVTDHKEELTGAVMALAAWQAVITGQAWTYFSSPGVVLGRERFEDQPGFFETPRMVAVAERFGKIHGINWGTLRLMHGDPSRDNVLKIATGGHDARIDQAIDAAKGVCFATVYGPEAISAKPTPGWTWFWVNPSTAEIIDNVDVTRSMKPGGLVGVRV